MRIQAAHDLPRLVLHRGVIDLADRRGQLAPEEEIARRVEIVGERERLVNGLDAEPLGITWIRDGGRLAVDPDLAGVRSLRAGKDLHQRRLAGAVAADQPHDLAGAEVDRDVVDGADAAE